MDTLSFVWDNLEVFLVAVTALLAVAALVASRTETKTDDEVVSKLQRVLDFVRGFRASKSK